MPYQVTDKSTQHGIKTPHGFRTPHKFPTDGEDSQTTLFIGLAKSLYPTGRAFNLPENGTFEKLHKGLNTSMIRLVEDAKSIIDKSIPDNDQFNELDATLWETRLGLFVAPPIDLESRKTAILRKMAFPGNVKARQHPLFIENQLQLAGFDVKIYENKFFEGGQWVYKTPDEISATNLAKTQHGGDTQHGGGTQHGSEGFAVIANSEDPNESYSIGGAANLWATFFISGSTIEAPATVPKTREREFRQLVLKLKPAHTVAYLFVNFN